MKLSNFRLWLVTGMIVMLGMTDLTAQTPQWVRNSINTVAADAGAIATDAAGNVYMAIRHLSDGQLFVAKLNAAGTLLWSDVMDDAETMNVQGIEIINDGGTERMFIGFDSQTVTPSITTPGVLEYNPATGAIIAGVSYVDGASNGHIMTDFAVGRNNDRLILLADDVMMEVKITDFSIDYQWYKGTDPAITFTVTDMSAKFGTSPDFTATSAIPANSMTFFTGSPLANTKAPTDATNYTFPAAHSFTYGVTPVGGTPIAAMASSITPWNGATDVKLRAVVQTSEGTYVYSTQNDGSEYQVITKLSSSDVYTVDWSKRWVQQAERGGILADENNNIYLYSWDGLYGFGGNLDALVNKFDKDGTNLWSKTYGVGTQAGNDLPYTGSAVAIDKTNQEIVLNLYNDGYNSGNPSALLVSTNYDGEIQNYTFVNETGKSSWPLSVTLDGNRNAYGLFYDSNSGGAGVFKVNTVTLFNAPTLSSATKDSDTQITVTFSDNVQTNGTNPTDFTVTDGSGTTFAVSEQADGTAGDKNIVLTVANLSTALGDLKVTYANNNNEISDSATGADFTVTDATGVAIDADATAPTLSSATKDSDTQITVTFSEAVQTDGTNPTDFTVTDGVGTAFAVSAQADGTAKDSKIVLTVADLSTAVGDLTVKYTNNNNEISDFGGNDLATNVTGVSIDIDTSAPTLTSATKDSNTQITITLSEKVQTNGTNPTDFSVTDGVGTSFVVSAQADGTAEDTDIVLTVADLSGAVGDLKVTYTNGNDEISDFGGNSLATDATGMSIDTDTTVPTLVSATKDNDTQITLTLSEAVQTNGANPTDFVVVDGLGTNFAVSVQADGTAKDTKIILTVANLSTAVGDLKVTYTNNNNEISDFGSNSLATDATGVSIDTDTTNPTMVSGARDSDTQLTITFSEEVKISSNDPNDFTVTDALAASFTVTGLADGTANDTKLILTIADFSSATGPLKVTYTRCSTIEDFGGNALQDDATGVSVQLLSTIAFTSTSSNGSESINSADLEVSLDAVSTQNVSINYAVTGTATGSGTDFTLAAGTVIINAGSTTANITIASIVNDALNESNETVIVTLSTPTNGLIGTNTIHTYTINDNDATPTVAFALTTDGQSESEPSQDIQVSLSAKSGLTVTVDYTVTGTATAGGTDHTTIGGTITFDPGDQDFQQQIVGIVDDALDEDNETIILTLSNPTNATLGTNTVHTYTITDNDAKPTVSLSADINAIAENGGSTVLTATLSAVSGRNVTITVGYSGSATNGTDYNSNASTSITINAGSSSSNAAIAIASIDDADGEGDETVIADITGVTNGTENGDQTQTITIVDDDDVTAPSGYTVTWNDALIGSSEVASSTFTWAGAEVGATFNYTVSSDGGGTNVMGTGTISTATDQITLADLLGLGDGTLTLSVTLTDPSGNVGVAATDDTALDATAPSAPSVTSITSDTGINGADQITSDNTPDVNGTAEANSSVEVFVDGASVGTTTADGSGNWTMIYNGDSPADDGILVVKAKATDAAGNTSAESSELPVTIDASAPAAPAVTSITTDTGIDGADEVTNDNTLNLNGTAEANTIIEVFIGGISIGSTNADGNGDYTYDHTGIILADGLYIVTATATDAAGNLSAESTALPVTVDTNAPEAPTVELATASDLGISSTDRLTSVTTPAFEGTAEPGATIKVFINGEDAGTTATADDTGKWTLIPGGTFDNESLDVTATATDAAGNVSAVTPNPTTVVVDSNLSTPLMSPADNALDVLPSANLVLTFGENINKGTGDIVIKQSSDNSVLETIDISSSKVTIVSEVVTIDPANIILPPATEFYVNVDAGAFTDDAGNAYAGISNNTDWTFTIIAASTVNSVAVPTDGTYMIGDNLDFTVDMILPVTITGTATLPVTIGSTVVNATQVGTVTGSSTILFRYTVLEDALDVDGIQVGAAMNLNGGTMKDEFDVDAILTINNVEATTAVLVDGVKPTATISSAAVALVNGIFSTTVEYDEQVENFVIGDLNVTNGVASNFVQITAGKKWSADITPTTDGTVTVALAAAVATDVAGNDNKAATNLTREFDGTAPEVVSINRKDADPLVTGTTSVDFRVIFSEDVTGVDLTDLAVVLTGTATGSLNTITMVDAKTYDVNVNGVGGLGTIGLNLGDDDSIEDAALNKLGGTGTGNGDFTGQTYTTNFIPTDIAVTPAEIAENNSVGDDVGALSATDADGTDVHTFSLVSGTGDTDNASFTIDGTTLKAAEAFDFETKTSYSIRVSTSDGKGGTFEKVLTITITNVLEGEIVLTGDLAFDPTGLGYGETKDLTITNIGEKAVEVRVISLPAGFTMALSSAIVEVGQSITAPVVFRPSEVRTYSGLLVAQHENGQATIAVTGEGAIVTGIDDSLFTDADISLYPNPATTRLEVDLSKLNGASADLAIHGPSGILMMAKEAVTNRSVTIDVSSYDSGMYILLIKTNKSIVKKKVIIRR